MEQMNYWRTQGKKPLFADVDLERPEQRVMAGRLLVIGGSKGSFFAAANAVSVAREVGVGEVRVLLPDSLKRQVPGGPEVIFASSEGSGGFSKDAVGLAIAAAENADYVLMIGDMGKNSETASFAERVLAETARPVLLTRDAVDLVSAGAGNWLTRPDVTICASLPQLQKILRGVYYPKMVTLSMPLNQLVEVLHKFTVSYPLCVVSYHNEMVVVARGGEVVTTALKDTGYTQISLWSGELAVKIAGLGMWNPGKGFEAAVGAVLK